MATNQTKQLLRDIFAAGVARADPRQILASYLPEQPRGRCIVIGAGKASAAMAQAVESAWPDVPIEGAVVVPYEHGAPTKRIRVLEASHPVPDENSVDAALQMISLAESAGPDDLVLALVSGGGSSLLTLPDPRLSLADKIAVNKLLLKSGLNISQMNQIRRRLSAVKGGRLALAARGARVVTLLISDIPGDTPHDIASGPTVPAPDTDKDISHVIGQLEPKLPESARDLLRKHPVPMPDFDVDYRMIATPRMALEAAASAAREAGITPLILGDALEGEAREAGTLMAGIATSASLHGYPVKAPVLLLSGGETTVTIGSRQPGRGGRNTEFLLALALALRGRDNIFAFAGDTDGIDGTEDAAGAIITPDTLARAEEAGLDPRQMLASHDSYSLFSQLEDLIVTGPTLTNVNDLRGILVL
ncbi:glycerate kinase type-2 family protein [Roseibium sp.]|uniref:glycerate kinase type-2 family protein n=1 Tax=Roseibium sp. TaxID=1936156 RepID=UPI003A981020